MKITMNVANLKTVFEACKTFVSKEDTEPILQTVQMNFRDKICTAYALNGVKLITVSVLYSDGDEGTINVPIVKLPKSGSVNISDDNNEITFDFINSKQTVRKHEGNFPKDLANFFKQEPPTFGIIFDPRNMCNALKGFKDEITVKMNFTTPAQGCVIEGTNKKALILPILLKD